MSEALVCKKTCLLFRASELACIFLSTLLNNGFLLKAVASFVQGETPQALSILGYTIDGPLEPSIHLLSKPPL